MRTERERERERIMWTILVEFFQLLIFSLGNGDVSIKNKKYQYCR